MSSLVMGVGPGVPDGFVLMDELEALPLSTGEHDFVSEVELLAACQASLGVEAVESLKIYKHPMLLLGLHEAHALFRVSLCASTEV